MLVELKRLRDICMSSTHEIWDEVIKLSGIVETRKHGEHGFIDRGGDILAVSHVDWVGEKSKPTFDLCPLSGNKTIVFSRTLDDRLGVWTILDMLPRMGIVADVLITDGEESGRSTGQDFVAHKQYKWIVEFDRRGTDVVTYKYKLPELSEFFSVGYGSFSDISAMDLGCQGFNVGVGYHNEHSEYCFASMEEWAIQMTRFKRFYQKYQDVRFIYKAPIYAYERYSDKWKEKYPRSYNYISDEVKIPPKIIQYPTKAERKKIRRERKTSWCKCSICEGWFDSIRAVREIKINKTFYPGPICNDCVDFLVKNTAK